MAALDSIRASVAAAEQTLANEVAQINAKLANATTPEEIASVQADLETLRQHISNIIPDEPTTP